MVASRQTGEIGRALDQARAELANREQQVSDDFARRNEALDEIASSLEAGVVSPEGVQSRLKDLLSWDKSGGGRADKGRKKLRLDVGSPGHSGPAFKKGPSKAMVVASLTRSLHSIEHQIVLILSASPEDPLQRLAQLRLTLLTDRRQSMMRALEAVPDDALLLEDVLFFSEDLFKEVQEMQEGGQLPLARLVDHLTTVIATELAMGGPPILGDLRTKARELQQHLRATSEANESLEKDLLELWEGSAEVLKERCGEAPESKLYEIIFPD